MFDKIVEIIKNYVDENKEIKLESSFSELNLDSLDITELSMTIEDEFNVELKSLTENSTVNDLICAINDNKE